MKINRVIYVLIVTLICSSTMAQLALPKILGHNMVLQRNQPVAIWGFAKAGDEITVSFHQQIKKTTTDANGNWKLFLEAMQASATPSKLEVKSNTQSIVLDNILVGEVWLCSGQSNMEYAMRKLAKTKIPEGVTGWPVNEVETAHNKDIRIFLVERKKMKPDNSHAGWSTAEDSALRSFSAVGYFFAKKLYEELKVPVGVMSAAIPGSRIEPWMPREAFTALPFFNDTSDATHKIDGDPGKFYETMIAPLIPFTLKGFLWYQGESNCFLKERLQYTYKMKALIEYWRKQWNNNSLPFYYVQIAPFEYSKQKDNGGYTEESLPEFWEAQALAMRIPNTSMIATTDLNHNLPDLHPVNKWDVGKRLALCALNKTYSIKSIVGMSPVYKNMKALGNTIQLEFDNKGGGLVSKDGQSLTGFTIAAKDGRFVPATAIIKNGKIEVSAVGLKPVAVRFCWNEATRSNLCNKEGLPALPFRTDNPLEGKFK